MNKIEDYFVLVRNGASIKQDEGKEGYPITRIETIANGIIDRNKMGYADVFDLKQYSNYILISGDILMSHINSEKHLGKVAIYKKCNDEIIIHGMNLLVLRSNRSLILDRYSFYYFKSDFFRRQLPPITKKSVNQASFTTSDLKQLIISPPEIKKQIQIADILDKLSRLIECRKQQIEKQGLLVKSQFIELFGDTRDNPKGWEIKRLGDIGSVGSSKRVFVEELVQNGIPFYRGTEIGALATGENIIPELFITEDHYKKLSDSSGKPTIGDLLMPSICPDGRIWRVDTDRPFYFKDGRVLWVHLENKQVNSLYLQYALREKFRLDYKNIASGTTFAELKIFALKDLFIILPPIELQNQFASFVQQVDKSKFDMNQSLERLEQCRNALMQEAFG